MFYGIKILYVSKNTGIQGSMKKLRSLMKKIKKRLFQIIIDSIKNIYNNFQSQKEKKRTAFMNNHNGGQQFQIAMSWLKFYQKKFYFYNFYSDKSET